MKTRNEGKGGDYRERNNPQQEKAAAAMSLGIRPHRAFAEAIPIAQAQGLIQKAMSGPEQIFDIAIVSKIPYTFARVMFAPQILAPVDEIAEYYQKEIARAPAYLLGRGRQGRALDPFQAWELAVLPRDAGFARRD